MAKKCPPGKYYCFDDKKCKKIPRGYHIGARGYLARDTKEDDSETKKNGNGSSNGNGNGGNGAGNGNGGSGGNGGGNGGGGMGESIIYEKSNPRIPRKKGQPAKSKKHSDLYTDEDPKGTIHGLGFKDVAKAKASVSKIRNSSRSHAHKIQAAVAMEQRAREMGKTSEAAVYRKYINAMKKKTKRMNEDKRTFGKFKKIIKNEPSRAVVSSDKGRPLDKNPRINVTNDKLRVPGDGSNSKLTTDKMRVKGDGSNSKLTVKEEKMTPAEKRKDTMLKKKYDKSDMKKSMQKQYGKEEGKKVYFATIRKQAMESVSDLTMIPVAPGVGVPLGAMKVGASNLDKTVDATTSSFKKKKPPTPIKSKTTGVRTAGMKEEYVSEMSKGKIPKESQASMLKRVREAQARVQNQEMGIKSSKPVKKIKLKKSENKFTNDEPKPENEFHSENHKYNVSEEGLRDWFGKSSGTTKSGRKVRGWVQVGGKYDGKPCARQPGQKSTPKCVSSSKRRSMSKNERDSAARRKRAADPNQPQKSGAAKPTNVSTDPKKKMKESFVNEAKDKKGKGSGTKDACYHKVKSRYSVWPSAYASGALVKCRKVGAANWGNKSKNEGFSPMQVAALEAAGMIEIKEGQKCWKGYEKKGTKMMFGKRYNNCVKKKATKEEVEHIDEKMINVTPNAIRKRAAKSIIKKDLPKVAAGAGALAAGVAVGNKMTNTNEGVEFLKRKKKEEKEKKKSSSEYLTQRDAGKLAKRKMAKKDQEKVNFLEPEETNESKTRLVKNGHTYKVVLTWRGKTYMVQMFVPSVSRPTRQQIEKEVQKLYPDAKVMSFLPRDLEPGEPTVMMGEEKRDEYGDIVGGPKISKKQKAKNLAKNEKDEDHTTTTSESYSSKPSNLKKKAKLNAALKRLEDLKVKKRMSEENINELSLNTLSQAARQAMTKREFARGTSEFIKRQKQVEKFTNAAVKKRRGLDATKEKLGKTFKGPDAKRTPTMEEFVSEDDMKGMSVKSGHKRPTKAGAGMTQKGVEAYRRRNPGSKLKTAVTGKVKKGSKAAKRRKSYCARSAGQMKKFPKAAKDPNSRLRQARRRWKC